MKIKSHQLLYFSGLLFIILLRLPNLFEPLWHDDEAIYLTIGNALAHGGVLYKTIFDNKPPLIYWLSTVFTSVLSFKLLLLFISLSLYVLVQKIFTQLKLSPVTSIFAAWFVGIGVSLPSLEGNILNGEILMLLPIALGLYTYLSAKNSRDFFASGLAFSLASLAKTPAVFDFIALVLFVYFSEKNNLKIIIPKLKYILLGFLSLHFFLFFLFALQHNLSSYLQSVYFQNLNYINSYLPSSTFYHLASLILLLVALSFFYYRFRRLPTGKANTLKFWSICYFCLSLFSVSLSLRPYPHYLLQLLLPLAIFLSLHKKDILYPFIIIFIILFTHTVRPFKYLSTLSYYQNSLHNLLLSPSLSKYRSYFDPRVTDNYASLSIMPSSGLYIWGTNPSLYALSRSFPANKYTVSYQVQDHNAYAQVLSDIQINLPQTIVWMKNSPRFQDLETLIKKYYYFADENSTFYTFKLRT